MHVLIVEDDAKIAEFVARGFREAGFRTTRAADGEDGLLQAQHGSFDAAIVDIMLPKMDGLELIRSWTSCCRRWTGWSSSAACAPPAASSPS